ncbi:siderophore-interacting protein [Dactylosporangium sp. NPDC049742]|uniref:siderophore-interacting protein n=1 Tax=Dactylosporangium sp. NPDC049742 TaxID=3154737 RepID=UPI003438A416
MTFDFFDVTVLRKELLSPSAVRLVFGGADLAAFASGGRDQRFKLFLPRPHQRVAVVPRGEDWYPQWRAADPATRAVMRTYTVREQRGGEFDVDFAVHDTVSAGPASTWARHARPGDRAVVLAPTVADNGGVDFRPPPDTDWVLLTGDESALPALAGILAWVGRSMPVRAWIEVHDAADVRDLPRPQGAELTWLVGGGVLDAVRAADLPPGTPYAWVAGESGVVRSVRRHLVHERGIDRRRVMFTGYWRRGATEDDLIAEAA